MITPRNLIALFPVYLVCGCASVSKDQQNIIDRAARLGPYPVSRSTMIKSLNLESVKSERLGGGARGGWVSFLESWALPSGLTITGSDSEFEGDMEITRCSIDEILNNPDRARTHTGPGDFIQPFPEPSPRRSFKRITVSNARDKVIFDSIDSKMKNDESASASH